MNGKKRVRNHGVYPRFYDRVKNALTLPDKLLMLRGRETGAEACRSKDKKKSFWEVNAHSERMECSDHRYLIAKYLRFDSCNVERLASVMSRV